MSSLFRDGRLHFAVGIEDTFVAQEAPGRRRLDEYELTQHYLRWHEDLGLAAATGATAIRYGFPWHRVNPAPGSYRFDFVDRVVDRLEELGLEVIVDLVHYGTPLWLDNQALNADYPARVADYAATLADRYRGRLRCFTPLNEPLVNAQWCGELGAWPPYLTGEDGYVKLALAICRGICQTQRAIADVTADEATFVHVEAGMRYVSREEGDALTLLRGKTLLQQDLVTGRVDDAHPLAGYLRRHGVDDDDLQWFRDHAVQPDVMGINYYPHLSTLEHVPGQPITKESRRPGGSEGLEEILRAFADRYGAPVFLTETSAEGDEAARLAWLDESVAAVHRLRAAGVAVVGYTWWPLFHLVDWDYRDSSAPLEDFLVPLGMYDLRPDSVGVLERVPTAVVDRFRAHATGRA